MHWTLLLTALALGAVAQSEWDDLQGHTVRLESTEGRQLTGTLLSQTDTTLRLRRSSDGALVEVPKDQVSSVVDLSPAPAQEPQQEEEVGTAASTHPDPPPPDPAPSTPSTPATTGEDTLAQTAPQTPPEPANPVEQQIQETLKPVKVPAQKEVSSELLYRDGYTAGQLQAATERTFAPAAISACAVGGATALGCVSPIPALGCVLGLGTLGLPPAWYGVAQPLLEEPRAVAAPSEEPAPYAVGYAQGYLDETGKRKAQAAMLGGTAGLLAGALVGISVAATLE
ncbi:MAG: LSm family protein [Myxococcota bacterium]|nr:LSm family protein [Myxococcota bacterium]